MMDMILDAETLKNKKQLIAEMESEFQLWRPHYDELARHILPRRYMATQDKGPGRQAKTERNQYILDGTGTFAARVLASGMMNGVTSPARPWFHIRIPGFKYDELNVEAQRYLDEVERRMQIVLAGSNFYNAMAVNYLDLGVFGTSATLIYEDFEDVIRCYNVACGEYRLAQDSRRTICKFNRIIPYTLFQLVQQFGIDRVSHKLRDDYKQGGAKLLQIVQVYHLIEPNDQNRKESLPAKFEYREFYFEQKCTDGKMLQVAGYHEKPGIWPRWELIGNDSYGTSPGMDALPDIIQLQQETKRKGQALDKMVSPPLLVDAKLQHNRVSTMPNGLNYIQNLDQTSGARPLYTVQAPIAELTADIAAVQARIYQIFQNDLFRMISQLDTVRSATEIDARREEKLVLLGPVLQRFENEALDPALKRVFNIMQRKGLLPDAPEILDGATIEVEYVSVLADAQRAVGTATMERFLQAIGETAAVQPDVLEIPNWPGYFSEYAYRLNIPAIALKTEAEAQAAIDAKKQAEGMAQAAQMGTDLTGAAKNLSQADVGGGVNALQAMLQ